MELKQRIGEILAERVVSFIIGALIGASAVMFVLVIIPAFTSC